jgi:fatty-acyl-CoA synthase
MHDNGIGSWTARRARMSPDRVAVIHGDDSLTYRELHERATRMAHVLTGLGVSGGDRVAYLGPNEPAFLETLFATGIVGGIFVPLNTRLAAPELAYILADSGTSVLVHAPAHDAAELPVPHVLDRATCERLLADAPTDPIDEPVDQDDVAMIMYTSGTTGRPKGAVLTHANLHGQATTLLFTSGADINRDVGFIGVPLFHIAGIGGMIVGLLLGLPTVIYPLGAFEPGELLDVVEAEKVTGLFLVPAQWQAVCAAQQSKRRELGLRVLTWGAAPASDTLLRQMADTFPGTQILAAFGQTEMSPVTCMLLGEDAIRKLGSVGKVIPTVAARIVDDDMNDVGVGQVGEIVYRAPTLMAGYWNNPEATAEAFSGGWFHSGDLVRQDDEGYIWVVDRKKDMIISGGENIYCAEVENALAAHPAIVEVAVIGRPDDRWGEVPIAVAAVAGDGLALSDLHLFLNERLARYKHPKGLEIVDALPRNPAGKVLKTELRARFGTPGSVRSGESDSAATTSAVAPDGG